MIKSYVLFKFSENTKFFIPFHHPIVCSNDSLKALSYFSLCFFHHWLVDIVDRLCLQGNTLCYLCCWLCGRCFLWIWSSKRLSEIVCYIQLFQLLPVIYWFCYCLFKCKNCIDFKKMKKLLGKVYRWRNMGRSVGKIKIVDNSWFQDFFKYPFWFYTYYFSDFFVY